MLKIQLINNMNIDIEEKLRIKCEEITGKYREEAVKEAFSLLLILLKNIVNKPTEEKFRLFKRTNAAIKSKILVIKECLELVKDIGYVDLDGELLVYQDSDLSNVNAAIKVLNNTIEAINKKLAELEMEKEIKNQEEARRLQEEVNRKFIEEKMRKLKIQQQIENDKKEKAQMEKPKDSVGNKMEYGAKVCKFEPKQGNRG